jgi:hypothetical protein
MKEVGSLLVTACLLGVLFLCACSTGEDVVLVAIGDSLTMGIQSAGLVKKYQLHSFPYLIAKQMGVDASFEQPYVRPPGFGTPPYAEPLQFENGKIISTYLQEGISRLELLMKILPLLENLSLERPYNNLGVGGAWLQDIRHTTSHNNSVLDDNFLFDLVLRNSFNPNFGNTTVLQQAVELKPTIVLLWIGNNDILRAVMEGGDSRLITDPASFRNEYTALLSDLEAQTDAHIFLANIPGYLAYVHVMEGIVQSVDGFENNVPVPVLFNSETMRPITFGDQEDSFYIPLLTVEGSDKDPVQYLVQDAIERYFRDGLGIPDKTDLQEMGLAADEGEAQALFILIQDAMTAASVTMGSGVGSPFTGDLTITESESSGIVSAVSALNDVIEDLSSRFDIPLVDVNHMWDPENEGAFGGYSGEFVLDDPENTVFSLDGVHPNNLGHAIIANAFIDSINRELDLGIPKLNPEDFKGQYASFTGTALGKNSLRALGGVSEFFIDVGRLTGNDPGRWRVP